jgi:hypothetical protein
MPLLQREGRCQTGKPEPWLLRSLNGENVREEFLHNPKNSRFQKRVFVGKAEFRNGLRPASWCFSTRSSKYG